MIIPQTLKGFRDFLPSEARKRQFVINKLKSVFETFGFEPLETPTLEYEEILSGKYGEEGEKLMYRFEDNGKRRVAMRYDQTVPLARVVAQYQNQTDNNDHALSLPFKRYQIQNVWRADKPQKGRYREFLQCDADIIGMQEGMADSEILAVVAKSVEVLGFTEYKILVNDRKVFGELPIEAIIIIDKLKKIGEENVLKELKEKGYTRDDFEKIKNAQMPESLQKIIRQAALLGIKESAIQFDPTLARGLDYYTGLIFEIEISAYPVGSVCGGGRYDNLLGLFTKSSIPAVGFAFGFDRIIEAMTENNLFPDHLNATASVLVTIFSPEYAPNAIAIAKALRNAKVHTDLWIDAATKIEKQLKYADQKHIPFVLIVGPEEIKNNLVLLKNMATREQQQMRLEDAIKQLA